MSDEQPLGLPPGEYAVGPDFLHVSPDGREAFVIYAPGQGLAFIATDIHGLGQPHNAVGFTPEALRSIAGRLERLMQGGSE